MERTGSETFHCEDLTPRNPSALCFLIGANDSASRSRPLAHACVFVLYPLRGAGRQHAYCVVLRFVPRAGRLRTLVASSIAPRSSNNEATSNAHGGRLDEGESPCANKNCANKKTRRISPPGCHQSVIAEALFARLRANPDRPEDHASARVPIPRTAMIAVPSAIPVMTAVMAMMSPVTARMAIVPVVSVTFVLHELNAAVCVAQPGDAGRGRCRGRRSAEGGSHSEATDH